MQVQSINNNYNTNFGMAVTASDKGKQLLEKHLTKKGFTELKQIVEAEKNNPTNVHITTRPSFISTQDSGALPYDEFVVRVEDKAYTTGFRDIFSTSKAMMSAIKRGVKHARELTEKREVLKEIPTKNPSFSKSEATGESTLQIVL